MFGALRGIRTPDFDLRKIALCPTELPAHCLVCINTTMRIVEIASKLSNIVYHVTPTKNLVEIMSVGLVPQIGPRSSQISDEARAIYVFQDKDSVEDALMNWLGDEFNDEPLSLLEINIKGLTVISGAGYESLVTDSISPDRISILNKNI